MVQLNDNRDLWREIKKLKPTAMVSTSILDGFNNDADIANCMTNYITVSLLLMMK